MFLSQTYSSFEDNCYYNLFIQYTTEHCIKGCSNFERVNITKRMKYYFLCGAQCHTAVVD